MTSLLQGRDLFVAEFERLRGSLPGPEGPRRRALERFALRGFPTPHEEEWRHTDLTPLAEIPFRTASPPPDPTPCAGITGGPLREHQIVFVNGRHAPSLSSGRDVPGVTAAPLAVLLRDGAPLEPALPEEGETPFADLNAALFSDGAGVLLRRGAAPETPIHLLFLSTPHGSPYATHPRVVISLEEEARATVVESFLGPAGGVYLTNAVTRVFLGRGARLDYIRIQRESPNAFHLASFRALLEGASRLAHFSISLGARLARNDLASTLRGPGAETTLHGLYEVSAGQLVDHHTAVNHAAPGGTSRQLYKGILEGRSRAVFVGRIAVAPGAGGTDAHQLNRNLLLSPEARVHTQPQLEILARDVRCKHGATVGQLDPDLLFYLRSRGLGLEEARRILIHAFACEIVDRIPSPAVRAGIGGCLGLMSRGPA